jgi:hypothetical protein
MEVLKMFKKSYSQFSTSCSRNSVKYRNITEYGNYQFFAFGDVNIATPAIVKKGDLGGYSHDMHSLRGSFWLSPLERREPQPAFADRGSLTLATSYSRTT